MFWLSIFHHLLFCQLILHHRCRVAPFDHVPLEVSIQMLALVLGLELRATRYQVIRTIDWNGYGRIMKVLRWLLNIYDLYFKISQLRVNSARFTTPKHQGRAATEDGAALITLDLVTANVRQVPTFAHWMFFSLYLATSWTKPNGSIYRGASPRRRSVGSFSCFTHSDSSLPRYIVPNIKKCWNIS